MHKNKNKTDQRSPRHEEEAGKSRRGGGGDPVNFVRVRERRVPIVGHYILRPSYTYGLLVHREAYQFSFR